MKTNNFPYAVEVQSLTKFPMPKSFEEKHKEKNNQLQHFETTNNKKVKLDSLSQMNKNLIQHHLEKN